MLINVRITHSKAIYLLKVNEYKCHENLNYTKLRERRYSKKNRQKTPRYVVIAKIVRQMSAKHLCVSANLTGYSKWQTNSQSVELSC